MEKLYELLHELDMTYCKLHKFNSPVRVHSVSVCYDGSGRLYHGLEFINYFDSHRDMLNAISSYHSSLLQKINERDAELSTEKVV